MHVYLHPSFSVLDHVTIFVAYDGKWEYDGKDWFFKNCKSLIMVVPKRITLSEITHILNKQFEVNKELHHLKLEVHYKTGSIWFPITEIRNNQDLSVFISEASKAKLPLCVTRLDDADAKVVGERRKDDVTLFVAYNGKWEYDGKEWFFKNSKSLVLVVPKYITLPQITDILNKQLEVDKKLYHLKLEVHYRTGSHWFPVTQIQNNQDLSVFISETSKAKLPLCVTRLDNVYAHVGEKRKATQLIRSKY
uniref:Ankyrin repeat family protein n=1 Tax=Tanacetum cinerariifolium TaxID=118510 RepID=A0A6L2NP61_TANCI|nr:ankyrin repeat family protein [Tanacetum cinerariifolium]